MTDGIAFIEQEIVLADGLTVGEGLASDPWIRDRLLAPILAVDEDGLPRYRLVYLELPRGHWKSGGVAAVATGEAALLPSTDVVIAAADSDQARIILENIGGYLRRNPALGALFMMRKDEFVTQAGSRIRVISSDAPSAYGLGGTHERFRVICDELTTWRDDSLWVALVSAGGKVEDTQTIVLSNAGYDAGAASSWQWSVRQTADEADWGYLFSAPGVIASWITPSWVEQMRALLPSAAFDRLIGNVWTTGAGDFVTQQQWRACVDERLTPTRTGGGRRFGALDLGLVKDRTAISVLHWEDDLLVLDQLDVWEGSRDEPVSIRVIENALLDAARRYPGLEIYCDPWQFKGSMERLRDHLRLREFTFSASSVQKLSAVLHHAITSAALRVYPDADLEREILGLRVVESAGGWRFDHRRGGFSDRAVSLGMAVMLAHERGRPRGERGSWVCRDAIPEIDAVALGATVAGYG